MEGKARPMTDNHVTTFGTAWGQLREDMEWKEKSMAKRLARIVCKKGETGDRPAASDLIVNIDQYNGIHVACRPGLLKAPFRARTIRIYGYLQKTPKLSDAALWQAFGQTITELMTAPARASRQMLEVVDRIDRTISGTGMELIRYHPIEVGTEIVIAATVRLIDQHLQEIEARFHLESGNSNNFRFLTREAKAQAERLERQEGGLLVDVILYNALAIMTGREMRRLADFLNNDTGRGRGYIPEYRNKEMADRGIRLPDAIETIKAKDGIISGRVRLSENLTFNRNRMLVAGHLPTSLLHRIKECTSGDVVQHPWVPTDAIVTKCIHHNAKRTAVHLKMPLVHFPSGVPAPTREEGSEVPKGRKTG